MFVCYRDKATTTKVATLVDKDKENMRRTVGEILIFIGLEIGGTLSEKIKNRYRLNEIYVGNTFHTNLLYSSNYGSRPSPNSSPLVAEVGWLCGVLVGGRACVGVVWDDCRQPCFALKNHEHSCRYSVSSILHIGVRNSRVRV